MSRSKKGIPVVWTVGFFVVVVLLLSVLAGCEVGAETRQQLETLTTEAMVLDRQADELTDELAEVLEAGGAGSEVAEAIREKLTSTEAKRDAVIRQLISARDAAEDGVIDPNEAGQLVTGAVSTFLPGYGPIVGLVASIGFGIWERYRRRKQERATAEVVHSVDVFLDTMTDSEKKDAKRTLRLHQPSQEARQVVAKAKGKS